MSPNRRSSLGYLGFPISQTLWLIYTGSLLNNLACRWVETHPFQVADVHHQVGGHSNQLWDLTGEDPLNIFRAFHQGLVQLVSACTFSWKRRSLGLRSNICQTNIRFSWEIPGRP